MASPMKDRGKGLKPFKDQRIEKNPVETNTGAKMRPDMDPNVARNQPMGPDVWHGVNPNRHAAPLPPIKGPAPGRAARRAKGLPGY